MTVVAYLTEEAELRRSGFAHLVATAISKAVARAETDGSRARIVAAEDEARRRIERDLHDGAQQRLVTLALRLRSAASTDHLEVDRMRELLTDAEAEVVAALDELREVSHGIHPTLLSEGGLGPALRVLSRRCAIPVELDISLAGRLAESVEVTGYYVVSEALTNAAKHAHASVVRVVADQSHGALRLSIGDDGVGGADPTRGSGLIGLTDRVEALGGTILVKSPVGSGTTLLVSVPLD
jgi:signal transduction histidine kinase